jgi:hypothetical protein
VAPNRTDVVTETSGNTELFFEDFLHKLDADQNPSSVVEGLEAEHRLNTEFYTPMVLLDYIIQVLTTADLDRVFPPVIEFVGMPMRRSAAWLGSKPSGFATSLLCALLRRA